VGAIVPWNFPVLLAVWKIAPALATGNTIIVKPSPFTPLCTLKLGELCRTVLPPGVFNVVSGGDELGKWMTEHPGIAKIAFTGHTETGKHVMRSAAGSLKRLTLELAAMIRQSFSRCRSEGDRAQAILGGVPEQRPVLQCNQAPLCSRGRV